MQIMHCELVYDFYVIQMKITQVIASDSDENHPSYCKKNIF